MVSLHYVINPKVSKLSQNINIMQEKRRHLFIAHIAGFAYYEGSVVFPQLEMSTKLELRAELNNKFDPYAVAVYFGEHKLGFIPRDKNKELYKFVEMGHADIFDVRINRLSSDKQPEDQVGISVHILPRS
ncbi:MAG: DNA-binding protein [Bacteroidia bacterium]|nr:MAG: DNA-binding protein [Bacteroidia bacterium]